MQKSQRNLNLNIEVSIFTDASNCGYVSQLILYILQVKARLISFLYFGIPSVQNRSDSEISRNLYSYIPPNRSTNRK